MEHKRICPKCKKLTHYIHYGRFKVGYNKFAQRVRCMASVCRKTSTLPYQHPFFSKMKTTPEEFHEAIKLYGSGYPIKHIAKQFKKRPNTIIDWVKKVKSNKFSYSNYLKTYLNYDYMRIKALFSDLSYKEKQKRIARLKRYTKATAKSRSLPPSEPS